MKNKTFNSKKVTLIESENLYQKYLGERYGYRFKAEYEYKKTQSEAIYHRINIVCREIMSNSPQLNVEISIDCLPLGISEKTNFITDDLMTTEGAHYFCEEIIRKAFQSLSILEQSKENERKTK